MRLTLRTLLAYLDDLLEPSDTEELGRKIEESEFASTIVNRIHDCMRRLRLGVPNLNGRGMGGDPNTVAEYLDNSMAPDLVPEFERVCLESDMHLAEVAACHQILTLVLGEPAEIDPESRQRMYGLGRETAEAGAGVGIGSMGSPPLDKARQKPEVPAYLRESESTHWTKYAVAAAVVALLVIVGASLRIRNRPVATAPTGTDSSNAVATQKPEGENKAPDQTKSPTLKEEQPAPENVEKANAPVESNNPPPEEPTPSPVPADATPPPADADTNSSSSAASTASPEAPGTNPGEPVQPSATPARTESAPVNAAAEDAETTASNNNALGRYVSEGQLLLRFRPPDDWFRLPARDALMASDQIVSLPAFRGAITLNSGVTAQVLAATRVGFQYADSMRLPEISIDFGRVMLLSSAHPDAKVVLRVGAQTGVLSLSDPSSVVAVEVIPVLPLGADPMSASGVRDIKLYASQGAVGWQGPGAAAQENLVAPAIRQWGSQDAPTAKPEDLPIWATSELELSEIDRRAAEVFVNKVTPDRSARLSLTELANDRHFEVKSLAVRSLGLIDSFEPLVAALGESTQRSAWADHIRLLRMSMARGPEHAAKVREAFEKKKPQRAAELYRMLCGYTDEQLRQGGAAQLVSNLDSSDFEARVLANWNLEQITGESSRYRPHDPPNLRQPQIRRWKLWAKKYESPSASTKAKD